MSNPDVPVEKSGNQYQGPTIYVIDLARLATVCLHVVLEKELIDAIILLFLSHSHISLLLF